MAFKMMESVRIRVLDYYNKPKYYPFMPLKLFDLLEKAYLAELNFISVPSNLFYAMIIDYTNSKLVYYNYNPN